MAKKLSDILLDIDSKAKPFRTYLEMALDEQILSFLNLLSTEGNVYFFSGVIRNYFLKIYTIRDLDIVLDGNIQIEERLKDYEYRKNSFGGYKVIIAGKNIDIWFLENTWALNYQKNINHDLEKYIPLTAFFNFSSIVFSFNENKFYASKHFCRFLKNPKIDLVYSPNANQALCVINSLYYSEKLNISISEKLRKHLIYLYKQLKTSNVNYEKPQLKHFGEILYSQETIDGWINKLSEKKVTKRVKKSKSILLIPLEQENIKAE